MVNCPQPFSDRCNIDSSAINPEVPLCTVALGATMERLIPHLIVPEEQTATIELIFHVLDLLGRHAGERNLGSNRDGIGIK